MKTKYSYTDLTKYGSFSSDTVYKRDGCEGTFDKIVACKENK